jgi:hypothetical protein
MEPPKQPAEAPPDGPPVHLERGKHPNSEAARNKGLGPNQYRDQKGHIRTRASEPAPEPTVPDPEDPLAAMKRVLAGTATPTPLDQAFVELLSRDPVKYLAEKRRLEAGGAGETCPALNTPTYDASGTDRCPTCRRYPGTADPDDPITPMMSDDEVNAQIEKEFQEFQEFLAERRASGSPPSPRQK